MSRLLRAINEDLFSASSYPGPEPGSGRNLYNVPGSSGFLPAAKKGTRLDRRWRKRARLRSILRSLSLSLKAPKEPAPDGAQS